MGFHFVRFVSSSFSWKPRITNVGAAAILSIEVQSGPGSAACFDVGFCGDLCVAASHTPEIYALVDGQGFSASAYSTTLYFLCGSQPMVTAPSTYWFGSIDGHRSSDRDETFTEWLR
jgi:hypothetical protein